MKKYLSGLITGIFLSLTFTALATELNILPNPYPVFFNGVKTEVEGYNINGYSFLKLADFKKIGLTIKFNETDEQIEVNSVVSVPTQSIQSTNINTTIQKPKYTVYKDYEAVEYNNNIYVILNSATRGFNLDLNYDDETITLSDKNGNQKKINKTDTNYCVKYGMLFYIKASILENLSGE